MEKIKHNDWKAPTILILSAVFLIVIFIIKPKGLVINSDVFIGSLTALFGLLGITFQINSAKTMDARRRSHELEANHQNSLAQIRMETYDARRESYLQLLEPFMEALSNPKAVKQKNQLDLVKTMVRINIDLHLFGSDESCRILEEWRSLGLKGQSENPEIQKKRNTAMLIFYSRLILSIRRDLGQQDTKIDELGILRSFLTDLDQNEKDFHEALQWESASDVP